MVRFSLICSMCTILLSRGFSLTTRTYFGSTNSVPVIQRTSCRSMTGNSNKSNEKPIVICGPSGVGKGTLINKFMQDDQYKKQSEKFGFSVSHTTRSPRPGEINGIHYHFTDTDDMKRAIETGEFLEYAEVHGNLYGTSLKAIEDVSSNGKICLLDIDVQGVKNIKALGNFSANYIFIAPPSVEILKKRLTGRGTETSESIERRTNNAIDEMEYGVKEGNFDHVIVNDRLDDTCDELCSIIKDLYHI